MSDVAVRDVAKSFGPKPVLEGLDFTVDSGAFCTMVGASGCGKTTFLRMLLGVEQPTSGQILIGGTPLAPEPGVDRGVVFQRYSVFPHLSVLRNVILGLEFRGNRWLGQLYGAARGAAVVRGMEALEAVGLAQVRDAMPTELSGGMLQRLAIAQALIVEPRFLLLDEPFGALDPGIRNDMHELIDRLWRENDMTIFMITHDLKEAFKLGTRVLTFDKVRHDIEAPDTVGATITYDLPGYNNRQRPSLAERNTNVAVPNRGAAAPTGGNDHHA